MKEAVASDIKELQAIREYAASEIGTLDDFLLDFSNMESGGYHDSQTKPIRSW